MKILNKKLVLVFSLALFCSFGYGSPALAAPIAVKNETSLVSASDDKKLHEATVNLYCRVKVGNKEVSTTGSGVIIDPRGVILTNAHVAQYFLLNGEDSKLKTECTVRTGSPAKEKYKAKVLYISSKWLETNAAKSVKQTTKSTGEHDFALLYITEAKQGKLSAEFPTLPLNISLGVKKGDEATIIGYPTGNLKYKEIKNKLKVQTGTTTITSLQTFKGNTVDLMTLSRSKLASSGISGGPVVSGNNVTGIIATRSTSKSKDGASLRAITLSYINRAIMTETGLPLIALYATDLATLAAKTKAGISAKTLSAIERPLRTTR